MVPRWRIFGDLLRPVLSASVFSASRVQHVSDLHPKFAQNHTMCAIMADIQSLTADIIGEEKRRWIDREIEEITEQKYNGLPCS